MNDVVADVGSAPAPAETTGAIIDTNSPSFSPEITGTAPVEPKPPAAPEQQADKPSPTVTDAIKRANDKVKAARAEADKQPVAAKPEAKPDAGKVEPKPEQLRGEAGRFAPKEAAAPDAQKPAGESQLNAQQQQAQQNSPHREAPARFTGDAKAAWEQAPEPVKAEVYRAIRELEQGHQKYKGDAEAFHEVREYDTLAKQTGTTLKAALTNYVGIERMLAQDPIGGLERVISNMNFKTPDGRPVTLRDIAAQVLGQSPDEQASRTGATIQRLETTIAQLQQQLGGVTQHIETQTKNATVQQVEAFANSHPRFDELAEAIKQEIGHGYDLETAYQRAERLNPAATKAVSDAQPVIPAKTPAPLNPAGMKSITGAPSAGSDPEPNKSNQPVPSIEESLKKAFRKAAAA